MKWFTVLSLAVAFLSLAPSHEVIFKEKKCPVRNLKGGRVRIRSKGRVIKYVCNRGFQVLGAKYSTCIRGRWDSPAPVCISSGCLPINVAHGQVLKQYRGAFVVVHCDPDYTLVGTQNLYCNGANWNDTAPSCLESTVSAEKECDFESEYLCGWTHDANHEFDWKRHNFATPSGYMGTGPSFDHTHGSGLSGHYMYLETSSPRLENDTARLVSPLYSVPSNQNSCFKFWYHMYGNSTGSLNVYIQNKNMDLLFSKSGNQGDQWWESILKLPLLDSNFQIVIEGVRGSGYEGDIAIDDVKLTEGDDCLATTTQTSTVNLGVESSKTSDEASCENRCFMATSDQYLCECHMDCVSNHTCCQDYLIMCGPPSLGPLSSRAINEKEASSSQSKLYHSTLPVNIETQQVSETGTITTAFHLTPMQRLNTTTLPAHTTSDEAILVNTTPLPVHTTSSEAILVNTTTLPVHTTSSEAILVNTTTLPVHTTSSEAILVNTTMMSYRLTLPVKPTDKKKSYIHTPSSSNVHNITITETKSTSSVGFKPQSTTISSSEKSVSTNLLLNSADLKNFTIENDTTTVIPKFLVTTKGFGSSVYKTINRTLIKNNSLTTANVVTYQNSSTSIMPTRVALLSTTKKTSLQGRPTIVFKTPLPPIVLRPAKTTPLTKLFAKNVTLAPLSSTMFSFRTHNPKEVIVNPSKQSKNDVLHTFWIQHDSVNSQIDAVQRFKTVFTTQPTHNIKLTSVTRKNVMGHIIQQAKPAEVWIPGHKNNEKLPDKADPSPTYQSGPILLACVVLVGLSVLLLGVTLIRRHRINRSRSEDDELDIRFLPSDEMLDFTLARPSSECQRV